MKKNRISPLLAPVMMTVLPCIFDASRHQGYLKRLTAHNTTPITAHHTKLQGGTTSNVTGQKMLSDR